MEADSHCGEVAGQGFGVSLLQLLDEGLDVGRDYFFHSLLLLLVGVRGGLVDGEDVKTVQELLRHANGRITLEAYTQAVTSNQ